MLMNFPQMCAGPWLPSALTVYSYIRMRNSELALFFLFFSKALQMPFLVEFLWAVQIGQNRPGFQGSWTLVRDKGWGHEHNLICLPLSPVLLLHLSLEWWPWVWSLSHSVFRRETSCFLWGWKSNCYLEVCGGVGMPFIYAASQISPSWQPASAVYP